jgi:TBC1 domain family member 8/9
VIVSYLVITREFFPPLPFSALPPSSYWSVNADLTLRPSMHGTLLDQRVFESLVQRCIPIIHDHFAVVDVQLSVASLPWFLSLYVASRLSSFVLPFCHLFFLLVSLSPSYSFYFVFSRYMQKLTITVVVGRFINSMPMVFAFRIVDCFFCMGPKVLFQVG